VKRTYVYVDGFNIYYRALKKTKYKWLNLEDLVKGLLDPYNEIQCIRYFTAPVSGKLDPGQPIRQQRYLQALSTLPCVPFHQGNFLTKAKWRPLVNPAPGGPTLVEIWNTEEKGSRCESGNVSDP
jgi:hypothetical protein